MENQHPNQDAEHFHHSGKFPGTSQQSVIPQLFKLAAWSMSGSASSRCSGGLHLVAWPPCGCPQYLRQMGQVALETSSLRASPPNVSSKRNPLSLGHSPLPPSPCFPVPPPPASLPVPPSLLSPCLPPLAFLPPSLLLPSTPDSSSYSSLCPSVPPSSIPCPSLPTSLTFSLASFFFLKYLSKVVCFTDALAYFPVTSLSLEYKLRGGHAEASRAHPCIPGPQGHVPLLAPSRHSLTVSECMGRAFF